MRKTGRVAGMALPSLLSVVDLAQPLAALIRPVLWFFSPAFRERTRRRRAERGRRERIGDGMAWCVAWIVAGLVVGLIVAFGR